MAKARAPLDARSLVTLNNVAAGHEGVMSDADGLLVIKPCTQAEVAFYESAASSHEDFASFMPTFMGTLKREKQPPRDDSKPADAPTAATLGAKDPGPMHGKALETDLCIVLENIAASFAKPSILDVKLGARLWDDDAPLAKRARLDDVAAKSTSGSLGFRIAGMQVWRPDRSDDEEASKQREGKADADGDKEDKQTLWQHDHETHYSKYNKMYGRSFTADNKHEGFEEYLGMQEFLGLDQPSAEPDPLHKERVDELLDYFVDQTKSIQDVLEKEESRMYSASILFVYEGDLDAYHKTKKQLLEDPGEDDQDDDDDEKSPPRLAAVKMIDFAHAKWAPGEGPDENVLQGVRSVIEMFRRVRKAFDEA